ncbi:MAG: ATP-binding cassette domain-containing protein [Muribaculaceae bacterium]|nr:ATP-binding cassette domain-containing protein [Muribaculaceae bacterium]
MDSSPIIEYKKVELSRQEHVVLRNVNLRINDGEMVYLIGRVGSGKSTLLKSMYAEVPVKAGSAIVLGRDMSLLKRSEVPYLRREIGIVFQDFRLLTDRTIQANLEFVLRATGWDDKQQIGERIEQVLKEVGMLNKSYKMPHELSGGEQQRMVIARALLNHPKLILADEPTGNLDPETGEQIVALLQRISDKGVAVVMGTHNLQLVEMFPARVLRIDNKQLIEEAI